MRLLRKRLIWMGAALGAAALLGALALAPAADGEGGGPPGTLALAGLLGLVGAGWWQRRRRGRVAVTRRLRRVEQLRLEPGRSLHLVEVDGRALLLAAGERGLWLVTRLPKAPEREPAP
jgi:MYXO-CTERM domain-containing protein